VSRGRRILLALLGVVAVAALAAGLWVWQATRFPATDAPVAGTPITMRLQDGLGPADRAAFLAGLRAGHAYLDRHTGRPVTVQVEARLAHGDPCEPFLDPGGGGTGVAKAGWLCVDALTPAWRRSVATRPAVASGVPAHELVHVWQAELGCLRSAEDHEFLWLTEGTATAFAWWALEDAGLAGPEEGRASIREWGAFDPGNDALRGDERAADGTGDPEYARWHLAVRDLLRRADRGPDAVRDFCLAVGRGTPWRAAFSATFGLGVEDFYSRFGATLPAYRRGARPL
jgi:hypothetical protein